MIKYTIGGKKGKEILLKEAKELVVVRLDSKVENFGDNLNSGNKRLMNQLVKIADFKEANVSVYRCNATASESAEKVRNRVRRSMSKLPEVKFAGRVLLDQNGIINLYTENIFVKFQDSITKAECKKMLAANDLKIKKVVKYAKNGYFVVPAKVKGHEVFALSAKLLNSAKVELCHPEIIKYKRYKAIFSQQWHLQKTRIKGNVIDESVNVKEAWKHTEGKGITIAIIDDGVDIDHIEFAGSRKVIAAKDMFPESPDPRPKNPGDAHGTACAGVACANGTQKASGVAPEAQLMPIRLVTHLGSMYEADAFVWAADEGADVISCSWGPPDGSYANPNDPTHTTDFPLPDSTRLAIAYAVRTGRNGKGCIITWAAGNGRENVRFDGYGNNPDVLAIAACNDTGKRSVYSDFGKSVVCCFPSSDFGHFPFGHPDPKTDGIWTTDVSGQFGYNIGDYTNSFGGTSSACPGAAGVIALMLAANPELTKDEVKELIKLSTNKIDSANANYDADGHSIYYGYGRLDAGKAVRNALNLKAGNPVLSLNGYAQFKKTSHIEVRNNAEIESAINEDRLLGLALSLSPKVAGLDLVYRMIYNNNLKTAKVKNGELASLNDRRRKVVGLEIELKGAKADDYTISYAVFLDDKELWIEAADGAYCGSPRGKGPAIIKLKVTLTKRP